MPPSSAQMQAREGGHTQLYQSLGPNLCGEVDLKYVPWITKKVYLLSSENLNYQAQLETPVNSV